MELLARGAIRDHGGQWDSSRRGQGQGDPGYNPKSWTTTRGNPMSTKKLTPGQEKKAVELMEKHGMSQSDVAKRMGVQRKTIWELCHREAK